jgi:hypothetical protein
VNQEFNQVMNNNYNTNMTNPELNKYQSVSPGGPGVNANHSPIDSAATGGVTN